MLLYVTMMFIEFIELRIVEICWDLGIKASKRRLDIFGGPARFTGAAGAGLSSRSSPVPGEARRSAQELPRPTVTWRGSKFFDILRHVKMSLTCEI